MDTVNQCRVGCDGARSADQIALNLLAAFTQEGRSLRLGLHAFCDDRDTERFSQTDYRVHNLSRLRIVVNAGDKGSVDLDLVEGERL